MVREDYILREISKIGDLLMALIGKIKRKDDSYANDDALNELCEISDCRIDDVLFLTPDMMLKKLQSISGFNLHNIELFGLALFEMHTALDSVYQHLALERASFILEYVSETDNTYSVERQNVLDEIIKLLG